MRVAWAAASVGLAQWPRLQGWGLSALPLAIVLGIVLTAGTFIFVSSEFSLVALDQASVERRAVQGDRRAAQVLREGRITSAQLNEAVPGLIED